MARRPELIIVPVNDELGEVGALSPPPRILIASPSKHVDREAIQTRLSEAARRREAFRSWVLSKARGRRGVVKAPDDRRHTRLQKIRERQAAAEATRTAALEAVRAKAATLLSRREDALARLAEERAGAGVALEARVAAAAERRSALREAERERLRAEHQLVLTRLTMATAEDRDAAAAREARERLDARMAAAEEARVARLAEAAARAGSTVARAKEVSALTRQLAAAEAETKRAQLEARLAGAAQRREARVSGSGTPATGTGASTPARRTSVSGTPASSAQSGTPSPSKMQPGSQFSARTHAARGRLDFSSAEVGATPFELGSAAAALVTAISSQPAAADKVLQAGGAAQVVAAASVGDVLDVSFNSAALQAQLAAAVHAEGEDNGMEASLRLDEATMLGASQLQEQAPLQRQQQQQQQDPPIELKPVQLAPAASGEVREEAVAALRRSFSTRKLQAAWRVFAGRRRTTAQLAQAFVECGATRLAPPPVQPTPATDAAPSSNVAVLGALGGAPSATAPRGMDKFDAFATVVQSTQTLRTATALLRRLEARLQIRMHGGSGGGAGGGAAGAAAAGSEGATERSVTRTLKRLFPGLPRGRVPDRYPPRVLLCALMIIRHPEVVFSSVGPREAALAAAARDMAAAFEALLERILDPPPLPGLSDERPPSRAALNALSASPLALGMHQLRSNGRWAKGRLVGGGGMGAGPASFQTVGQMLVEFDEAWASYLDQFAAWKLEDAASLEAELIRIACEMERSVARKVVRSGAASPIAGSRPLSRTTSLSSSPRASAMSAAFSEQQLVQAAGAGAMQSTPPRAARDLDNIMAQVAHDHALLRQRVERLGGAAGVARLEAALAAAREEALAAAASAFASDVASSAVSDSEGPDTHTPAHGNGLATHEAGAAALRAAVGAAAPAAPSEPSAAASPAVSAQMAVPAPRASGGGLKRGFFGAPARAARSTTSPAAAPPSAPPAPAARSTGSPSSATGHSTQDAGPQPMLLVDVRAPSVPRSPAAASPRVVPANGLLSTPLSPRASAPAVPGAPPDALSNLQMVHELVTDPGYKLGSGDAEGLWARARRAVREGIDGPLAAERAAGGEEREREDGDEEGQNVEEVIARLRARAKAVAEEAFWDACTARVVQGVLSNRLADAIGPYLTELASELADVMSDSPAAAELRAAYSERAVAAALSGDAGGGSAARGVAAALGPMAALLQRLAGSLLEYGAPVRVEEAREAGEQVRKQLSAALTSAAPLLMRRHARAQAAAAQGSQATHEAGAAEQVAREQAEERSAVEQLARCLARALRLLLAQLKLLKLDAANARLSALARQVHGEAGVFYLRSKFAALHTISAQDAGLAPARAASGDGSSVVPVVDVSARAARVAAALPRTAGWLRHAYAASEGVRGFLQAAGGGLLVDAPDTLAAAALATEAAAAAEAASAAAGAPTTLRTGLRATPGGASSTSGAAAGIATLSAAPSTRPAYPVALASWKGLVRSGVVALVSGETPAVGPVLSEALAWDAERLHAAQNTFQQLVVVTAGLLLAARTRAEKGRPAWTPQQADAARRRLQVLLADSSMNGPGPIVSELVRLARLGMPAAAAPALAAQTATDSPAADGVAGATAPVVPVDELVGEEEGMGRAFKALLSPQSAGFRSISNALASALAVHVLLGPVAVGADAAGAGRAVGALLGRVGARTLATDVAGLAAKLAALCGVSEAVHGELFEVLVNSIVGTETGAGSAPSSGPRGGSGGVSGAPGAQGGGEREGSVQGGELGGSGVAGVAGDSGQAGMQV